MESVLWLFTGTFYSGVLLTVGLFVYKIIKNQPSKKLFINFLKILGIGFVASMFPWLLFGLLGFPSVLVASIAVTFVFQKELS
jgi:hypothetical protein